MNNLVSTPIEDTHDRLTLSGMTKHYGTLVANQDISLTVKAGEIHAILGENGAGKSTLMKLIYGVVTPDAGQMVWQGRPVTIHTPAAARALGIGMVFQHFSLFETLTVVENVALALDSRSRLSLSTLAAKITEVSNRYGLPIEPHRLVHDLSVGERQRVEIVRCLLQNPRLLIMDEPTSVLTPQAVTTLFDTLRQLAAEGCSILYISHKLDEIQTLCDSATILRHGKVVAHCQPKHESVASMARMMIGRELPQFDHPEKTFGEARLEIQGLSARSDDPFGVSLSEINLTVHAGEIVGIAGVSGNGQAELLAALSGEMRVVDKTMVRLSGQDAGHKNPAARRAMGLGLCFVPEERLGKGAVPNMSLAHNALLTAYQSPRFGLLARGLTQKSKMRQLATQLIQEFHVKAHHADAPAASLSGGNLQKFIMGREITLAPQIMVVAQPTWGVDIGAAAFLRQRLLDLAGQGVAILLISEELEEIMQIADKIAVIAGGRLSPLVLPQETNAEQMGLWMSGLFDAPPSVLTSDSAPSSQPSLNESPV